MIQIPKVRLVPQTESENEKNAIGYKFNKIAGTRHFLGGSPEEKHDYDYPLCIDCGKVMTFYTQIDSIGETYDLADYMVIHTYVCFDCFTVKSHLAQLKALLPQ